MTNPTRARRRFTAQQKAEAVEVALSAGRKPEIFHSD